MGYKIGQHIPVIHIQAFHAAVKALPVCFRILFVRLNNRIQLIRIIVRIGDKVKAFICYRDYSEALLDNYREARADVLYQVSEKTNQIYKSASLVSNSYYYADELDTIIEANEEYAKEHRQSFNGSILAVPKNLPVIAP